MTDPEVEAVARAACSNCRYGFHIRDGFWDYHQCRRHSPVGRHGWSSVADDDWCGDYAALDDARRKEP